MQDTRIEQDLIISRVLVTLFRPEVAGSALAFRGGTALHRLHLRPPARKVTRGPSSWPVCRAKRGEVEPAKPTPVGSAILNRLGRSVFGLSSRCLGPLKSLMRLAQGKAIVLTVCELADNLVRCCGLPPGRAPGSETAIGMG